MNARPIWTQSGTGPKFIRSCENGVLVSFIIPSSFDIESNNDKVLIFQQYGKNLSRVDLT